jgi:peptide/nickel transport system permease protein
MSVTGPSGSALAGRTRLLALPRPAHDRLGPQATLILGLALLGLLLLACYGAPLLARYGPTQLDLHAILQPPSAKHWFGTDQYGRDIFSRTLYAGRVDFLIGLVLVGVALIVGTFVGVISAWRGGIVDGLVQRVVDIGFAFPFLVLVISIVGLRGPGLGSLFIAVGFVAWIFYARLVRSEVIVLKSTNYMLAARISGFSTARVLSRHLLPNVINQVVLYATSDFVYAILLGASVSYLGLGVQPPTPEWGAMVQQGQNFVATQWWISFFPGLAIVITGLAFALIGDSLADKWRSGSRR